MITLAYTATVIGCTVAVCITHDLSWALPIPVALAAVLVHDRTPRRFRHHHVVKSKLAR